MRYIAAILPAAIVAVFGVRLAAAFAQYDWMGGVLRVSEQYRNISSDKCTTVYKQGSYIKNGDIAYLGQSVCVLQAGGSDDYDIVTNSDIQNNTDLINVIGILPHDSPDGRFIYVDYGGNSIPGVAGISYHQQSGRVLAQRASDYNQPWGLYVYNSIISSLDMQMVSGKIAEYTVKDGSAAEFADTTGIHTLGWLFTNNGKHLMYSRHEGYKTVLRKVNLVSNTVEDKILKNVTGENISLRAATNNGRYLYGTTGSGKDGLRLLVDTEDCSVECSVRNLGPAISLVLSDDGQAQTAHARFSDNDDQLKLIILHSWYYGIASELTIDMVPENLVNFTYLALGDSFSSGEGDLGINPLTKANYYRAHTDDDGYAFVDEVRNKVRPTELCHVSTRSYPYKLATGMALGDHWNGASGLWGSVACSGALMNDMKRDGGDDYKGQIINGTSSPRLQGYDYTDLKAKGLGEMIPGRHKQIEFVEKYRPKLVTLTAGGNDVNFSGVVSACVHPVVFIGGEWTSTCSYAQDDGKKASLANAMIDLRPELVKLYRAVLEAGDPDMKLYVLGYPVFVDDERAKSNYITENIATCGANVRLNYQERQMVAESTKFLNKIIQSAAREAGAIYITTTDAFGDRKLCGKSSPKAVNGITSLINHVESFHPNEYGHAILANRVWDATSGQSLLDYQCDSNPYVTCPDYMYHEVVTPDYFKKALANSIKTKLKNEMSENIFTKIDKAVLTIADYTLLSNNPLAILLYSDRTELGTFTTNEQGGFTGEIALPASVKPGYHTLEVVSTDINGDPIKLWKIVEVRSGDPDDYDGDGIPNEQDHCTYIEPVGVDADEDGVDDGCDPEVSASAQATTFGEAKGRGALTRRDLYAGADILVRNDGNLLVVSQQGVADHWDMIRKEALHIDSAKQTHKSSSALFVGLFATVLAAVTVSAILLLRKRN